MIRGVHDRDDARWMPSRHHFALFRLYAFVRLSMSEPRPRARSVLIVDCDQSAYEHYAVSIWIVATLTCFIAAGLEWAWWMLPAALLLAMVVLSGMVVAIGLATSITGNANRVRINSIVYMSLLTLAAAYFARSASWGRFAAWQFLALVGLNGVAAVCVWLLRGPIARLEAPFAG